MTPEEKAREQIDQLLYYAGWDVQNREQMNLFDPNWPGVAVREAFLKTGYADYLLFVEGKALGVIEAKKAGVPLSGVEAQSARYAVGLPDHMQAWIPDQPLPFRYESTGIETFFTNTLDPEPRSRRVFAFHRPETLANWAQELMTLRQRLRQMPALNPEGLWRPQIEAIQNLEVSFFEDRPRALIQMATGSGKTFTAVNFVYRLVKHANARRVFQMYRMRWAVEGAFKFIKQSLGWEEVQLLALEAKRFPVALAAVAAAFLFEWGVTLEWDGVQLLARLGGWIPRKNAKRGKINLSCGIRRLIDPMATRDPQGISRPPR